MKIQDYIKNGYTFVSEGEKFVTLKKEKSISISECILFIIGIPMLFVSGSGLILWIIALLNYVFRSDKYITIEK